jgi:hypothetical protein
MSGWIDESKLLFIRTIYNVTFRIAAATIPTI